jgi:predicted nucleic acid-binding protein
MFGIENSTKFQKLVLEGEINWVTSSHLGPMVEATVGRPKIQALLPFKWSNSYITHANKKVSRPSLNPESNEQ